jgi:hypothetical protein
MIKLAGAVSLAFHFPAPLPVAYAYYSDLRTVLPLLPRIEVMHVYDDDHFRLRYSSVEFGGYAMQIFCDIRATMEGGLHMIRIVAEESLPPVEPSAGVNSSTARGYFTSRGLFFDVGDETLIEYEFELRSDLPRPLGMRLMPQRVVNGIASTVARTRMREVAQGFIEKSLATFPDWQQRQGIAHDGDH